MKLRAWIAGISFCLFAVITLLVLTPSSLAQTTISTGSIQGTVLDQSGAAVASAKITITNRATGQVITTQSNSTGSYNSGALNPGDYLVRVEAKGFKTTERPLTVQVNMTANGNVQLQLGQETQVVEVEASNVTVNTTQAEVQGVLTAQQIETLPVNGRNFLDLAQLEPGVQIQDGTNFDPTKVGYSSISFGGRFGRTARIEVDGVDVSDETVGTTTEDIPASAIQEFSLAQSTLDLSNELTSSGAVNVVTKSGTNSYHGEGFGLFRDHSMAASLPGGGSPYFQRNQEGANLGGALIKDKLFFFADGERTAQHEQVPILESGAFTPYTGTFPSPFKEGELLGRLDYQFKNAHLFDRFSYFQNSTYATFFPSSFQVYNNKDYTRQNVLGIDFNTGRFTHAIRFSYLKFQNKIVDATQGTDLPFANFPVSMNIGPLSTGPNLLAPQSTPQSDHQLKYDGSHVIGNHILRYGATYNHIQGGGFASFFKLTANEFGSVGDLGCTVVSPICPAGPDGTAASNPLNYTNEETIIGNGQGYSTEHPAFGFPAGGLGPDNRIGLYLGDVWKLRHNLTITPGLRWVRDSGRIDADLPAIPEINAVFPGYGDAVKQPNLDLAPQLGIAWDPTGKGKTVFRAGSGLFYENVIYNNVLFDRPLRLRTGAFLQTPTACFLGTPEPVLVPGGTIFVGTDPSTGQNYCADTMGQGAAGIAAFEKQYQALTPFNLNAPNPAFIGTQFANGVNIPLGLFAPNYKTPRSFELNVGFQHEIRNGLVLSADYVRNVETRSLIGVDLNHAGAARYLNTAAATSAITATNNFFHCGPGSAGIDCAIAAGATMSDYAAWGLTSSAQDFGGTCMGALGEDGVTALSYPCAFSGINPTIGSATFMLPEGRSVYNGLQMKLVQNVANPMRGLKAANFQVAYSLSRFENPAAFQGTTPPSPVAGANDQDFVIAAGDNDNPNANMGPSLLDRTHQISFGGSFEVPMHFRLGIIGHLYSPLSLPVVVGDTGAEGDIFRTDFNGDGTISDLLPGTRNGSFGRDFGVSGLNAAINAYNSKTAGQATPAGQALITAGLMSLTQLQSLGGVAPTLTDAPVNQLPLTWLRTMDFSLAWSGKIRERFTIEPSVSFYNIFNFSNYDLPPGTMNGWLDSGGASINSTPKGVIAGGSVPSDTFRVGAGTGVFGLGQPRVLEFGLKLDF